MRKPLFIFTLGSCSLLALTGLRAQTPAPSPSATSTPVASDSGLGSAHRQHPLQNLPPEDRRKLMQARRTALADPAVQAAKADGDKQALRRAMRETMLRDDPSLAPLLAKARAGAVRGAATTSQPGAPGLMAADAQRGGGAMEKRIAFLPEDERAKLRQAYTAARTDPQLATQRQQWLSAPTTEAKAQAAKSYREAVRNAMLRNDPSIAPILQKVQDHAAAEAGADPTAL